MGLKLDLLMLFQDGLNICLNCSKNKDGDKEEIIENKSAAPAPVPSLAWTDPETLLLLEGVLKHGDDWDLIAQHVRTRNKTECIARLIQLPFGEHIVGPTNGKLVTRLPVTESKPVEIEVSNEPVENNGEVSPLGRTSAEPPSKKSRVASYVSATDSLIKQVSSFINYYFNN
jgi:SWI/SNF related-matrix-associated actin-dependent regulator of chromatin subfamily C